MKRYDIAIIGTGPAGISAALTAKNRNKDIILFGSRNLSEKLSSAHRIDNYPGLPQVSGADFAAQLKKQLELAGIEITEKKIAAVYTYTDYFALQAGTEFIEAKTVIAAGGITLAKPLKGENEYLGRGVSYCATCDGALYKGKTVAVLGYAEEASEEAGFLSEMAEEVLYFPLGKKLPESKENIKIIDEKPVEIKGGTFKADTLITETGEHKAACIFVLRDAVQPKSLIPGIETDGPHIAVNLMMETSIPGIFAAGDMAGKPYQYVKAAGQGNVAALSAVKYLSEIKNK